MRTSIVLAAALLGLCVYTSAASESRLAVTAAARIGCGIGTEAIPISDKYVERRLDGWWIRSALGWNPIPPELVNHEYNSTGKVLARVTPEGGIVCFVLPTET